MKINCDFYEEQADVIDEEIVHIIEEYNQEEYSKVIEGNDRIDVLYALSNIRKNLISWYTFNKNEDILEVNTNFGELTEELCLKAKQVISIEKSLKKANAVKSRLEKTKNLEIVVGNLNKIKLNKKFGYIIINGVEENDFTLGEYLEFCKKYLKDNGTILFTCDNKFGIRNTNVNCNRDTSNINNMSKKEIEEILKEYNFNNYKFYYPLPNYKVPNVIFTDKHLPNTESILRDLTLYDKNEVIVVDEREKYKEIINENKELFPFFANSFLVEITSNDNKVEFVSFSNSRKEKYRVKTIMYSDIVLKQYADKAAKSHFENIKKNIKILKKKNVDMLDTFDDDIIYSRLIKEESLDKVLIEMFKAGKDEEAFKLIDKFINEIKNKLGETKEKVKTTIFKKYNIEISDELNSKLNYIKYGFFDIIFQNCFYIDNKFYFYDQEWMEENIPFEFIVYRSINYIANSNIKINRKNLYDKFKITEYLEVFDKLEFILQEEIKDKNIWNIHAANNTTVKNIFDTQTHYKNLKDFAEINLENERISKAKEISDRDKIIKDLTRELDSIKKSKYWKIIKLFSKKSKGSKERKDK